MLKLIFFVFVAFSSRQYLVNGQINMTEYLQMPPLYHLEDYDNCFLGVSPNTKATYCYVRSLIKPNASSEIWNIIYKYSSDKKRFYRHDRINRGICMDWCKEHMNYFDYTTRMGYYMDKFYNDSDIQFDPNSHTHALIDRAKYHKFAVECVNYELRKQYGLMAQTEIEYCVTNQDDIQTKMDLADLMFVILCAGILFVIVLSTAYDFHLKRKNLPHLCNREHYKRPIDDGYHLDVTLVSFSLPRNWYKLTGDSSSNSELSRDLRPINAIRCLCMFGVILGHAAFAISISPSQNPWYLEERYFSVWSMILINGANILQSYFAITGFLISVQFMDLRDKHKFKMVFLWKAIAYRYLRFTPVYLFMVFFHATWLFKLQSGPVWPHFADSERIFCRKNWWANILYINNFVTAEEPCVQQAWYLAADFQLTIVGTLIHMIIWKFTKLTKPILASCFVISFIIPAWITYANAFDGIFMATPENQRYAHWYDIMYHSIYIPSYANFGSFLFGMIGGLLYCKHKQGHIDLTKSKLLPIIWYSLIPTAFLGLMSGYIFFANNFERPAIWIALYAACGKNLWGIFGASLVIGFALNTGWIIKNIFRLQIFRTLGRLTFGAYIIHPAILRISCGGQRQPIYFTDMRIIELTLSMYVLAYFLSFLLCLTVEMPCSVLQKQLYNRENNRTEKTTIYETTEPEAIKLSKCINDLEAKNIKIFS